jgi:hypothetical protein
VKLAQTESRKAKRNNDSATYPTAIADGQLCAVTLRRSSTLSVVDEDRAASIRQRAPRGGRPPFGGVLVDSSPGAVLGTLLLTR